MKYTKINDFIIIVWFKNKIAIYIITIPSIKSRDNIKRPNFEQVCSKRTMKKKDTLSKLLNVSF